MGTVARAVGVLRTFHSLGPRPRLDAARIRGDVIAGAWTGAKTGVAVGIAVGALISLVNSAFFRKPEEVVFRSRGGRSKKFRPSRGAVDHGVENSLRVLQRYRAAFPEAYDRAAAVLHRACKADNEFWRCPAAGLKQIAIMRGAFVRADALLKSLLRSLASRSDLIGCEEVERETLAIREWGKTTLDECRDETFAAIQRGETQGLP